MFFMWHCDVWFLQLTGRVCFEKKRGGDVHFNNIRNNFPSFSKLKKWILDSWIGETMFEFVL